MPQFVARLNQSCLRLFKINEKVSISQALNGYHFLGESIYNPYDILLYFNNKVFKIFKSRFLITINQSIC